MARSKLAKIGFGTIVQSMVELAVRTRQALTYLLTTLVAAAQTIATAARVTADEENEGDLVDGLPHCGTYHTS